MQLCLNCTSVVNNSEWQCSACNSAPDIIDGYYIFAPELAKENSHFNAENFSILASIEDKHFWFRARNRLIKWAIKNFCCDANNYLEIGCGTGYVLTGVQQAFPNLKTFGSDIYVSALPFAKERLSREVHLFQMDARNIPYTEHFDLIGAFDVLEHIVEDKIVLRQIYKALSADGMVILTVPQHPVLWSKTDEAACHVRRYSKGELEQKLIVEGFEIVSSTSFVSLLLPLMVISRFFGKASHDPGSELTVSPFVNRVLGMISNLEAKLIEFGCRFPCGGSRLVVAKKSQKSEQ